MLTDSVSSSDKSEEKDDGEQEHRRVHWEFESQVVLRRLMLASIHLLISQMQQI